MKYITTRIQIALFFSQNIKRGDKLFYNLNEYLGDIIDNPPMNIPLDPQAPLEIPLSRGQSSNGKYELSISQNRVDLVLNNIMNDTDESLFEDFLNKTINYVEFVSKEHDIIRFGLISTTIKEDPNPVETIRNKFFNSRVIENPVELSLRYNNRASENGLVLNDISEISSQKMIKSNGTVEDVIVINRDINNIDIRNVIEKDILKETVQNLYKNLLTKKIEGLI